MLRPLLQIIIFMSLFLAVTLANAQDFLGYLTDQDGKYTGPSVEDNIMAMDTDKNGFVDVHEMRAFLELKHGKGYEKELLDKMEATAKGRSCSTPFAKQMYIDNSGTDKSNVVENSN